MSEQKKQYNDMSASEKKKEDWMNTKWRPMMGWSYMLTCIADFVIFPVLWSVVQVIGGGEVRTQWNPITLQGAGLYHIAMGAILGIAVYGRTQEKLNDKAGPAALPTISTPGFTPVPVAKPFTPAPAPAPVTTGFGGKAVPPPAYEPEL
jgi:hypothetical protein